MALSLSLFLSRYESSAQKGNAVGQHKLGWAYFNGTLSACLAHRSAAPFFAFTLSTTVRRH
jgi:TPR repeat protein